MAQVKISLAAPYNIRKALAASMSGSTSFADYATADDAVADSSGDASIKDQRYVNLVPESISLGDAGGIFYLTPRPGWAAHNTPSAGNVGSAVHIWAGGAGAVISCFGATNSTIYNGTTSLGTVTGVVKWIGETDIAGVKTLILMTDGGRTWWYNASPALTEITDTDFPPKQTTPLPVVGHPVVKDEYLFVLTTSGKIWHSDVGSVINWTLTSQISVAMNPDSGVALFETGSYIVAFGTESLEWFSNTGNPGAGSVLTSARREVGVGAVSADCITSIRDVVYWVGTSDAGGAGIYRMVGFEWQKWSQRELDSIIDITGTAGLALQAMNLYGQPLLLLRVGTRTYIINTENKLHSEWNGTAILWDRVAGASTGASLPVYAVSTSSVSGKVYKIDPQSYVMADDGVAYTCSIQTMRHNHDSHKRKRVNRLSLHADTWSSAGTVSVNYSDDDYATFVNHGTIDMTRADKFTTRLGMTRERAYLLTWTPVGPDRFQDAIELEVEGLAT